LDIYSAAYEVARDVLRTHPEINVLFGVNDDLILGAIQAALDLGCDPDSFIAVNIGGEGKTIFEHMQRHSPLMACLALFPEVVGRTGIEAVVRLWAGEDIGGEIITPCAVITTDNLSQFYGADWTLDLDAVRRLPQTHWETPLPPTLHRRVSFVIHFRTHEWYQTVARSMQERAREVGISLTVQDVNDDLKAEIRELRRLIGKKAADYVSDGDTIILDSGSTTINMAHFLDARRNLTVITNSAGVFQTLQRTSINLLLTGGQYQRDAQALVGRGAQLYLSEIRADKVFLVAGGLSPSFGISSKNQLEAEIRRAMINAASEVVVLADHTVIGVDSHSFVADLGRVHTLITDAGIPSADRLDLHQRGIKVIVADEV
jgi:DeoR/GlpR family transcriptional regulator of sugar metabolism